MLIVIVNTVVVYTVILILAIGVYSMIGKAREIERRAKCHKAVIAQMLEFGWEAEAAKDVADRDLLLSDKQGLPVSMPGQASNG